MNRYHIKKAVPTGNGIYTHYKDKKSIHCQYSSSANYVTAIEEGLPGIIIRTHYWEGGCHEG